MICGLLALLLAFSPCLCQFYDPESHLLIDLFDGYQTLVRPIRNLSAGPIAVRMKMQLVLLVNVDEKEQMMQTNVWLMMKWNDEFLTWSPERYGGIKSLRVPQDKVWMPDIVLLNNADGGYEPTYKANAVIHHSGEVLWVPPALLKSTCVMNVKHFPFDDQVCIMYFKSWTYGPDEVVLDLERITHGIDLSQYVHNYIWDIFDAPACYGVHNRDIGEVAGCDVEPVLESDRAGLSFVVKLRRKTLFYTVILIVPCVMMGMCTAMVYYLPTKAGEKIGMSIYILLSITVVLNLLAKILPSGETIPLLAKYVLLNFVLNIITIVTSVMIVNVYFRSPHTDELPHWVKFVFIKILAKLMVMRRPSVVPVMVSLNPHASPAKITRKVSTYAALKQAIAVMRSQEEQFVKKSSVAGASTAEGVPDSPTSSDVVRTKRSKFVGIPTAGMEAIKTIEYITEHLKGLEDVKKMREEWQYVSMVIDRLLLYIFTGITLGGTMLMFLGAQNAFNSIDQGETILRLSMQYGWRSHQNYMNIKAEA